MQFLIYGFSNFAEWEEFLRQSKDRPEKSEKNLKTSLEIFRIKGELPLLLEDI